MSRKLLILSDRTGLADHLINAGDRALTDGLNQLLARHWPGPILSAGWKNFPYYSTRALPPNSDPKQIRSLFDRWCARVDQSDPIRGRRQLQRMSQWRNSRLLDNRCFRRLDRYLRTTRSRGLFETTAPYLFREAFRYRLKTLVGQADLVVFNGGGLIADHLAFYLPGYLFELYYARSQGKHVVTLNQTIAVTNRRLRPMVAAVYQDLAFHMVREPLSRKTLTGLGIDAGRIRVAADTAFVTCCGGNALTPGKVRPPHARSMKRIAIIPRGDRRPRLSFWRAVCQWCKKDRQFHLAVVHTCKAHDHRLIKRLRERFPIEAIDLQSDYRQIIKALEGFDAVITDRYHGVIFAMLASTPFIGLKSTTFKIDGLIKLCRYPLEAIDSDHPDAVLEVQRQMDLILSRGEEMRADTAARCRAMYTRAAQAYADIENWPG